MPERRDSAVIRIATAALVIASVYVGRDTQKDFTTRAHANSIVASQTEDPFSQ